MTLQASGAISMEQIRAENQGGYPISLYDHRRGGLTSQNNAYKGPGGPVPDGGQISLSQFWGLHKVVPGSVTFGGPYNGTFTIPQHGIMDISIRSSGGGGGAGSALGQSSVHGTAGQSAYIQGGGIYLRATGGGRGTGGNPGSGGPGGETAEYQGPWWALSGWYGNPGYNGSGTAGGDGGRAGGGGGAGSAGRVDTEPNDGVYPGGGGGGLRGGGGGGGGARFDATGANGSMYFGAPVAVNVVVGANGTGGSNGKRAGNGGEGYITISWRET